MATTQKIQMETSQTLYVMHQLTDSGDHKKFNSNASLISQQGDNTPLILVNGIKTGLRVKTAVSGSNNVVDVEAGTVNLNGVGDVAVTASTDLSITRAATNVAVINSITVNSGGSIAAIKGTDSTDSNFSETRGAAGGPPYIPVGSIEIAQIRVTSNTAAAITAAEIFLNAGQHREYAAPEPEIDYDNGTFNFKEALPLSHTGDVPKAVYAQYSDVNFSDLSKTSDWVPASESISVSSTEYYDKEFDISESTSINAGTFTIGLVDGVSDQIVQSQGENLFFKFFPDKNKTPYDLMQGRYTVTISNPTGRNPVGSVTVAAARKAVKRTG